MSGGESEWVTLEEAASLLHVGQRTLRRYTQQGRVPSYVVGENQRWRRIRRADLPAIREQLSSGALGSPPAALQRAEVAPRTSPDVPKSGQPEDGRFSAAREPVPPCSRAGVDDWLDHT